MIRPSQYMDTDPQRAAARAVGCWLDRAGVVAAAVGLGLFLMGCGPVEIDEAMTRYRARIEQTLGAERASLSAQQPDGLGPTRLGAQPGSGPGAGSGRGSGAGPEPAIETRLPRRRERRVAVADTRIGPFEFLGLIGCPLSEVVAARNGPLGKLLVPTRRLAHEVELLTTGHECLASLDGDRAARLQSVLEAKEPELAVHRWNAIWLDAELERYLTAGPRALVGGRDPQDGPWQLRQLASAARRATAGVARDEASGAVEEIETALAELRDDPAVGPSLRALETTRLELARVADWIAPRGQAACDDRSKRLVRVFREAYLPLQPKLVELDRRTGGVLEGLDALYDATRDSVPVPPSMDEWAREVLDTRTESGLWRRYRDAVTRHASAWAGLFAACGVSLVDAPRS